MSLSVVAWFRLAVSGRSGSVIVPISRFSFLPSLFSPRVLALFGFLGGMRCARF